MKQKHLPSKLIILTFILVSIAIANTFAQQVKKISVQGFLKDGTGKAVADGFQDITFKLYSTETGGTAAWTGTKNVKVTGGVYSTYLGTIDNPIDGLNWGSSSYFVGVTIGTEELTPRTELTFAPYSLGSPLADKAKLADKATTVVCSGAVGDVKYSILNPTQFALENGNCWVPMDGSSMAGSKLSTILGSNTLPDISGAFVRSQEFAGKADRDPNRTSTSTIATLQDDAMQTHTHPLSGSTEAGGYHSHSVTMAFISGFAANGMSGSVTSSANPNFFLSNNNKVKIAAEDNNFNSYIERGLATNAVDNHTHTLSGNTSSNNGNSANETRPKNFNLWTYIRIN